VRNSDERALLARPLPHQFLHHAGIGERRRVAKRAKLAFGDLAQDAPHDLARARLRQSRRELLSRRSNFAVFLKQAIGVRPVGYRHDRLHIVAGLGAVIHLISVLEHVEDEHRIAAGDALGVIAGP